MPTDYNITAIQLPNGDKCHLPNKVKYIDISVSGSTYSLPSGTTYTSIKTLIDNGTVCILKVPEGTYSYKYYHLASATPTSDWEGPAISLCFTSCPDAEVELGLFDLIQIYDNNTVAHSTLSIGGGSSTDAPLEIESILYDHNLDGPYDEPSLGSIFFDITNNAFYSYAGEGNWTIYTSYTVKNGMILHCMMENAFYIYTNYTLKPLTNGTSTYTVEYGTDLTSLNLFLPSCDSTNIIHLNSDTFSSSLNDEITIQPLSQTGLCSPGAPNMIGSVHTIMIKNEFSFDLLLNLTTCTDGSNYALIGKGFDDTTNQFTINSNTIVELSIMYYDYFGDGQAWPCIIINNDYIEDSGSYN